MKIKKGVKEETLKKLGFKGINNSFNFWFYEDEGSSLTLQINKKSRMLTIYDQHKLKTYRSKKLLKQQYIVQTLELRDYIER